MKTRSLVFLIMVAVSLVAISFASRLLLPQIGGDDSLKKIVPLDKIVSGGPSKDGIPSIDEPKFIKPNEVDFLSESDMVVGVEQGGVAKVYALKILVWHEIVNDWFGDIPLVVTYCPLCYSSITYIRELDGSAVEFGTSGRLYKNDLVMYDRQSGKNQLTPLGADLTNAGNLWSQMLGQAIVGERAGQKLVKVPTLVMEWRDWKRIHPDTLVLSTDTGYSRAYGSDPYSDYYTRRGTLFPLENRDERLFEKEVILGIEYDEKYKGYPIKAIDEKKVLNDVFQNRSIVFLRVGNKAAVAFESDVKRQRLTFEHKNGQFVDKETQSVWNELGRAIAGPLEGTVMERAQAHVAFWFAWADFYPETEVYT